MNMRGVRSRYRRAYLGMSGRIAGTRAQRILSAPYSSESMMRIYGAAYRRILPRGRSIFITSMPKAGSTFLLAVLREVTGYSDAKLTYAFERNEQELYLPRLIDTQFRNTVTRHHTRATEPNVDLFNGFGIRPVVLVRDLFDSAVSARDHLLREGYQRFPALYATPNFSRLAPDEQIEFVISHAMPWYVQFYVSWYEAWRCESLDTLWLRYEDLVRDWSAGIRSVLEFHGLECTDEQIETAMTNAYGTKQVVARLNKGVTGRGQSELAEAQRARVRLLTRHYPDVDFSFVGLASPSVPETAFVHPE